MGSNVLALIVVGGFIVVGGLEGGWTDSQTYVQYMRTKFLGSEELVLFAETAIDDKDEADDG